MKKLSLLITEYKEHPSNKLMEDIISILIKAKNPEILDSVLNYRDEEWVSYGERLRVKRQYGKTFLATEVFASKNRYMCYCYRIDLNDYAPNAIAEYKRICDEFKDVSTDEDYFAAVSIAVTLDSSSSVLTGTAEDSEHLAEWYRKVEREVK